MSDFLTTLKILLGRTPVSDTDRFRVIAGSLRADPNMIAKSPEVQRQIQYMSKFAKKSEIIDV